MKKCIFDLLRHSVNHTIGDFLLGDRNDVHFGMGNRQTEFGAGVNANSPEFLLGSKASVSMFLCAGTQLVRSRGYTDGVIVGELKLAALIVKRVPLTVKCPMLVHHSGYTDFSVSKAKGTTTSFSVTNLITLGLCRRPSIQVNYNLSQKKWAL